MDFDKVAKKEIDKADDEVYTRRVLMKVVEVLDYHNVPDRPKNGPLREIRDITQEYLSAKL